MDRSRPTFPPHPAPPPPGPPRHPYPGYASAMPQPAPRQTHADPFGNGRPHDPFMSSMTEKRESHLPHPPYRPLDPPNVAPRFDTLQPAPHPPASPFHQGPPLFREDRQRSMTGSYLGGPLDPPQQHHQLIPAPSRHMPPPSSSPKDSSLLPHGLQNGRGPLPTPPAYPPGRDHGFSRPGSSMSLSHIMAADSAAGARQPPIWSPAAATRPSAPGGTGPFAIPPSPQHDRRGPYEPRRRTPERQTDPRYGNQYPGPPLASPRSIHNQQYQPPDHGLGRLLQHQPPPQQSIPPRPFSQPSGFEINNNGRNSGQRQSFEHPNMPPPMQGQQDGGASFEKAMRERAMSDLDGRRSMTSLNRPIFEQPMQGYAPIERPVYAPRHNDFVRPLNNRPSDQLQDQRVLSSPADQGAIRRPPPGYATDMGPGPGPAIVHGGALQFPEHAASAANHFAPPLHDRGQRHPMVDQRLSASEPTTNRPNEARKTTEDVNGHHRALLGINKEYTRRLDRASPLPQAVQGAQSQPPDIGRDPNIKSEFGRMFSGLGSGVGSTPIPAHTPLKRPLTPSSRTAAYEEHDEQRFARKQTQEAEIAKIVNTQSRSRIKRPLDDENKVHETGEGRGTPATTTRGKRNKYTIPAGHHHHPLPAVHHHHHHHKPEEALSAGANSVSATGFPAFKFTTNVQSTTPIPPHHHHHHPTHHHHHPQPKPIGHHPITTIMTKKLVSSVSHLPRHHLGSQLYAPKPTVPPLTSSLLSSPNHFFDEPNPLPAFMDRENCTYTIRVPRYYLTHKSRQAICAGRRLWGTDVYTDDSDPVAAAIHSGWIRGAWAPEVDEDQLTLEVAPVPGPGESAEDVARAMADKCHQRAFDAPPAGGPVPPMKDMDLHLTLLILPQLERYASSVWNGVKSRTWGGNHDGVSFKIERMEWVDEGRATRYEERGGAARRKRMAALAVGLAAWKGVQVNDSGLTRVKDGKRKRDGGVKSAKVQRMKKVGAAGMSSKLMQVESS